MYTRQFNTLNITCDTCKKDFDCNKAIYNPDTGHDDICPLCGGTIDNPENYIELKPDSIEQVKVNNRTFNLHTFKI